MSDRWIPNPAPFPPRPPHDWPAWQPPATPPPDVGGDLDGERPPSRTGMVLAVIGVALVAAIVTFLILLVVRPPKRNVLSQATTTLPDAATSTAPSTTLPAGPPITQERLDELTAELVPFVEEARMLSFTEAPRPVLDDDEAFARAFAARLARGEALLGNLRVPFEALSLNPGEADLDAAQEAFYGDRAIVFFDPVTDVLHVRAVPETPYVSASLVAALTEQLDDQHFDVAAMDSPRSLGDEVIGLRSLVVGDGQRIASRWTQRQSPADREQIRAEGLARFGAPIEPTVVPPALSAWLAFPSEYGGDFTANLVTQRTSAPLDAAFELPPDGSAQVLWPERFRTGTRQLAVAAPPADGPVTVQGTFGALLLTETFQSVVPDDEVTHAMSTYRGDALVAWSAEGASCARIDISTGEAPTDTLRSVITTWAEPSASTVAIVDDPDRPGRELIRVTACSPGAPDSTTTTAPPTTAPSPDSPTSTAPRGGIPPI